MKNFFAKKGLGFYFTAAAVVLALIGVILYGVSIENESAVVIVMLVLAMVAGAVVAVKPFKFTEFLPVIFTVIAVGLLTTIMLDNVAEIFFKNKFIITEEFIAGIVFVVLSLIAAIGGLIAKQEKE